MSRPSTPTAWLNHRRFVRAIAARLVADDAQRDDIEQETWLAALRRPPRSPETTVAWLRSTVHRVSGKWFRSEGRRVARERAVAVPETAPATADPSELVERVELEQRVVRSVTSLREPYRSTLLLRYHEGLSTREIAKRLGATEDAIRTRLGRGVRDVRASLDTAYGDRSHWKRGLVFVAASPEGGAAHASPAGASSITGKAGMTGGVGAPLLSLAGVGVVLSCLWYVFGAAEASDDSVDPSGGPSVLRETALAPEEGEGNAVDVVRSAEPPLAVAPSPVAAERARPVGSVAFDVVDAVTGDRLERVRVRLLAEDRFAHVMIGGSFRERLSVGTYELSLRAPGYEDAAPGTIEVAADVPRNLGGISMARGAATLEGRVDAPFGGTIAAVVVELRGNVPGGDDVSPELLWPNMDVPVSTEISEETPHEIEEGYELEEGDEIEEIVEASSDAAASDRQTSHGLLRTVVAGDGRFRFDELPGGTYWVRATAAHAPFAEFVRVDVPRGGRSEVVLGTTRVVDQVFVVTDEDGRPVEESASNEDSVWPVLSIEVRDEAGERSIAFAEWWSGTVAEWMTDEVYESEDAFGLRPAIDRARLPNDLLFPSPERPTPEPVFVRGRRIAPGTFAVGPLPMGRVTVKVGWDGRESSFSMRLPSGPRRVVLAR